MTVSVIGLMVCKVVVTVTIVAIAVRLQLRTVVVSCEVRAINSDKVGGLP
jgi:hypothetical protein